MLVTFLISLQIGIRGCAAVNTIHPAMEDLSQFSRGPETCPGPVAWPLAPVPISCDDPACQGRSLAVPPYRCRQEGGIMFGFEIFGCPCCPRVIDCGDPSCAGNPSEEVCQSELLRYCLCVPSDRSVPATAAPQVEEDASSISALNEPSSRNAEALAITFDITVCPRSPPVKCLDHQCRGQDDWKTATDSLSTPPTPRCNRADGKLITEGSETPLYGCPCCPEYIACSSTDCNGDANRACTSILLHGCFCDWPGRIMFPYLGATWYPDNIPEVQVNTFDALFDDPNFDPYASQSLSTPGALSRTSLSTFSRTRIPAGTDPRRTAPATIPRLEWTDHLPNRQEGFSRSQNSSVFVILDLIKHR